jgi:hypothetical protein
MSSCKLVADKRPSVPGITLFSQGEGCIKPMGDYLPRRPPAGSKDLNVILWLHGWDVKNPQDPFSAAARYATNLRESLRASEQDVVLIAPHRGFKWGEGAPDAEHVGKTKTNVHGSLGLGDLGKDKGLQAYPEGVLDQIAQSRAYASSATDKAPIRRRLLARRWLYGGSCLESGDPRAQDHTPFLEGPGPDDRARR